jgi:hypothetical protein
LEPVPEPYRIQDADFIPRGGLYAPPGVLPYDADEDRVQCHLCGGWFRALAPGHLRRHDTTADEYRVLVGLNPRLALTVPSTSQLRARQLRERITTDERVRAGMARGAALARSGALQARAREVAARRGARVQREQMLAEDGRQLGRERARAFRERRELRSRSLGFDGLENYLRQRYVVQRVRTEDLAVELGASVSAVRGDLDRYGIKVARGAPRRRPLIHG